MTTASSLRRHLVHANQNGNANSAFGVTAREDWTVKTSINITSEGSKLIGDKPAVLDGAFDNYAADNVFKATFGGSFGSVSFGNVAQPGLSEEFVLGDLSVVGSLAGGGDLGTVNLVYVPEPAALGLLALGPLVVLPRLRPTRV